MRIGSAAAAGGWEAGKGQRGPGQLLRLASVALACPAPGLRNHLVSASAALCARHTHMQPRLFLGFPKPN